VDAVGGRVQRRRDGDGEEDLGGAAESGSADWPCCSRRTHRYLQERRREAPGPYLQPDSYCGAGIDARADGPEPARWGNPSRLVTGAWPPQRAGGKPCGVPSGTVGQVLAGVEAARPPNVPPAEFLTHTTTPATITPTQEPKAH